MTMLLGVVDFVAKHVLKVEVMARNAKGVTMVCPVSNGEQQAQWLWIAGR